MGVIPLLFFAMPAIQPSMANNTRDVDTICRYGVVTFDVHRNALIKEYEKEIDYSIDKHFLKTVDQLKLGGSIGGVFELMLPITLGANFETYVEKAEKTEKTRYKEHVEMIEYQEGFFQMFQKTTTTLVVGTTQAIEESSEYYDAVPTDTIANFKCEDDKGKLRKIANETARDQFMKQCRIDVLTEDNLKCICSDKQTCTCTPENERICTDRTVPCPCTRLEGNTIITPKICKDIEKPLIGIPIFRLFSDCIIRSRNIHIVSYIFSFFRCIHYMRGFVSIGSWYWLH